MKTSTHIFKFAVLAVFASGAFTGCESTDSGGSTQVTTSVYYGVGFYDPWYYGDYDYDYDIDIDVDRPGNGGPRPEHPIARPPGEGRPRPEQPIARPPSASQRPTASQQPSVSQRPSTRPSIPSTPRPAMRGGGGGGRRR